MDETCRSGVNVNGTVFTVRWTLAPASSNNDIVRDGHVCRSERQRQSDRGGVIPPEHADVLPSGDPSWYLRRTMNRGDGLVQRRRVVNSSGAGGGGSGHGQDGPNADLVGHNDKLSGQSPDSDCLSQKDLNCNPTIDDDSDKETRLTLMEEVLLLGLKDKEVQLCPIKSPSLLHEAA